MLGGDGIIPLFYKNYKVNPTSKYNLTVTDKTVIDKGMQNLCWALCEEIQISKRIMVRAINLSREDTMKSIVELRAVCPE